MKSHYQILNLHPTCTKAEIKKAYRLLAVKYHPDKNSGSDSEERFREISESYLVLSDAARRLAYDIAKGFKAKSPLSPTGHTPAGILLMCKKIKEKVFNAGGRINKEMLFKMTDGVLTPGNIDFLLGMGDGLTNNLIIDEVVVCGIFMEEKDKPYIKEKLFKLANGSERMINRIAILDSK